MIEPTSPVQDPEKSILVVEDDAALRTLFLALLRREGFTVECVNDGSEALDRLAHFSYRVMLLDLMMPVTNGFDVLDHLEANQPWLLRKTIVTTGISERELAKVRPERVFAVLRKPFDIDRLIGAVNDCAQQTPKSRSRHYGSITVAKLDGPAQRFESALPELRTLLTSETDSVGELVLRTHLRRAVGKVAGVLAAAAAVETDGARAQRLARIARTASTIASARVHGSRHEH